MSFVTHGMYPVLLTCYLCCMYLVSKSSIENSIKKKKNVAGHPLNTLKFLLVGNIRLYLPWPHQDVVLTQTPTDQAISCSY